MVNALFPTIEPEIKISDNMRNPYVDKMAVALEADFTHILRTPDIQDERVLELTDSMEIKRQKDAANNYGLMDLIDEKVFSNTEPTVDNLTNAFYLQEVFARGKVAKETTREDGTPLGLDDSLKALTTPSGDLLDKAVALVKDPDPSILKMQMNRLYAKNPRTKEEWEKALLWSQAVIANSATLRDKAFVRQTAKEALATALHFIYPALIGDTAGLTDRITSAALLTMMMYPFLGTAAGAVSLAGNVVTGAVAGGVSAGTVQLTLGKLKDYPRFKKQLEDMGYPVPTEEDFLKEGVATSMFAGSIIGGLGGAARWRNFLKENPIINDQLILQNETPAMRRAITQAPMPNEMLAWNKAVIEPNSPITDMLIVKPHEINTSISVQEEQLPPQEPIIIEPEQIEEKVEEQIPEKVETIKPATIESPTYTKIMESYTEMISNISDNINSYVPELEANQAELLHELSIIEERNKIALDTLRTTALGPDVINQHEIDRVMEKLHQADLALDIKSPGAVAIMDKVSALLDERIKMSGVEEIISPIKAMREGINYIRSLRKAIEEVNATISAGSLHELSQAKLEKLITKIRFLEIGIGNIPNNSSTGQELSTQSKGTAITYRNILKQLEDMYKINRATITMKKKPRENPLYAITTILTNSAKANKYFDLAMMSPYFDVIETPEGYMIYNPDHIQFPIKSEDEISQIFNDVFMDLLESMPNKDAKRENLGQFWLYNKLANIGSEQFAQQSIYNTMLHAGLNTDQIKFLNKNINTHEVRQKIYNGVVYGTTHMEEVINILTRNINNVFDINVEDYRRKGVTIYKLKDMGWFPQSNDTYKILSYGINAKRIWMNFITTRLDWKKMLELHGEGSIDNPILRDKILEIVFNNITDTGDGRYMVGGKTTSKLHKERVLIFKDFDSWDSYHQRYGTTRDIMTIVGRTIKNNAKQQVLLNHFGPNPTALKARIDGYLMTAESSVFSPYRDMCSNGLSYLFDHIVTGYEPGKLEKFYDSANAVAIPFVLKNVSKYALFIEPAQAAVISNEMGLLGTSDAIKFAFNGIKKTLIDDIFKAAARKVTSTEIVKTIFSGDEDVINAYTTIMAVNDIQNMLNVEDIDERARQIYPLAERASRLLTKMNGANYLLEQARLRTRILMQRQLVYLIEQDWEKLPMQFQEIANKVGINAGNWKTVQSLKEISHVKLQVHPEMLADSLPNEMIVPMKALNKLSSEAISPKTKELINYARKFEQLVVHFVYVANMAGDSIISNMTFLKKNLGRPTNLVNRMVLDNIALFMSWNKQAWHHWVLSKKNWSESIKSYAKAAILLFPFYLITTGLIDVLRGRKPFSNKMESLFRTLGMLFGINKMFSLTIDALDPDKTWESILLEVTGTATIGPAAALSTKAVYNLGKTAKSMYDGQYADAIKYGRKLVPGTSWLPIDIFGNRIILDNLFATINSDAAREHFFTEIEDEARKGREYFIAPGAMTSEALTPSEKRVIEDAFK